MALCGVHGSRTVRVSGVWAALGALWAAAPSVGGCGGDESTAGVGGATLPVGGASSAAGSAPGGGGSGASAAGASGGAGGSAASCGDQLCDDPEDCDSCPADCGACCLGARCVFPGAEGFGVTTEAGRGGRVIHVTTLADAGPGSLREALAADEPRIVVFDVAGVIELESDLAISSPRITVAGQSAPARGILIRNYGLRIRADDVLVQHLAIRVGDDGRQADGSWDNLDALQVNSGARIVLDHLSLSWGIDETASVWGTGIHDVTIRQSIIAEGLDDSVHTQGPHSKGMIVGADAGDTPPQNVAILANLFAHNHDRNPQLKGGTRVVVANNVVYDSSNPWAWSNLTVNYNVVPAFASYLGNVATDGPSLAGANVYFIKIESAVPAGSEVFQADNLQLDRPSFVFTDSAGVGVGAAPVSFEPHQLWPSAEVMARVLAGAGARPASRDAVDARIADPVTGEVALRTGDIVDHSAGRWPAYEPASVPFDEGPNPGGDDDGDGYTNVEERLFRLAACVERAVGCP